MSKPRLLDLFCGAGGAAMGYHRAGFEVVGVDINPQPRYPFEFYQGDALEWAINHGGEFDAIHASPPCQRFTQAQRIQGREHPDLVEPTREVLDELGKPWVMENVPGSPLRRDVVLCGTMFGLGWEDLALYRHRIFEMGNGFPVPLVSDCRPHTKRSISIFGGSVLGASRSGNGYKHPNERWELGIDVGRTVMGCPWMTRKGLSQSIPPAYTEFLGINLKEYLDGRVRAVEELGVQA